MILLRTCFLETESQDNHFLGDNESSIDGRQRMQSSLMDFEMELHMTYHMSSLEREI